MLLIIAVAVLTYGGVIEVQLHTDKLPGVWQKVQSLAGNQALFSQIAAKGTSWKRDAEMWMIKDDKKKLELALAYVHSDTAKLADKLTKDSAAIKTNLPQAELLAESLKQVSDISGKISVNSMLEIDEKIRIQAADDTKAALLLLNKAKDEQKDMSDRLTKVVDGIKEQVSKVEIPQFKKLPNVAGTKDQK